MRIFIFFNLPDAALCPLIVLAIPTMEGLHNLEEAAHMATEIANYLNLDIGLEQQKQTESMSGHPICRKWIFPRSIEGIQRDLGTALPDMLM
tara:strand:- start:254 stop:529 length:276 start_codon:yes stop_codon:yes gene_type:complete